jgi:mannose-6-phosphate isomerase
LKRPTRRTALGLLTALPVAPLLPACSDPEGKARQVIDTDWHRADLLDRLLPAWASRAPTPNGAFRTAFQRDWTPKPDDRVSLTGQARLIYSFAVGHELTKATGRSSPFPYLDLARQGADFLLSAQLDPVHGGFFHTVGLDGSLRVDGKDTYGHAFALLALAELYRIGQDPRHKAAALEAWRVIETSLIDPQGGVYRDVPRNLSPGKGGRTQNPLMHMFEAVQALHRATGEAASGVKRLGDFVLYKLLQGLPEAEGGGARIPEWYDEAWRPLPTQQAGGYIDLGHQFEWAHLLTTASSVAPVYAPVAERVLSYALQTGYDDIDGGCGTRAYPDGGKPEKAKGWWQQAECLHALIVCARHTGRNDLWRRYEQTLGLVKDQLLDAHSGSWHAAYRLPCKTGGCEDTLPDPYHMVSLHRVALLG